MNYLNRKTALAIAGTLFIASCSTTKPTPTASTTVKAPAAAPVAQASPKQGMDNMSGMDHSKMDGMKGMDHSKMDGMKGMDHSKMDGMKGMDHSKMGDMKGMDHSKMGDMKGGKGAHDATAAGKPGIAAKATRTVNVKASDTMRFDPQSLQVKAGETIRFVVTNSGKLPHEFVIATPEEQKAHAQMMQKMPQMKHTEANALSLAPGETKTLTWQFGTTQRVELACHVPGHYPAGMVSKVTVSASK